MLGCTCASHRSTQSSGKQGHGLLQACCSLSALAGPAARTTSVKDWHLSSPIGMVPAAGTSPTNAAGFDAASLHQLQTDDSADSAGTFVGTFQYLTIG